MLNVRDALYHDFDRVMDIYRIAQDYMIESGNPDQWGHTYPDPELIKTDIREGRCKVIFDEDGIHGVFAFFKNADPTYGYIEGGSWLNDEEYVTIHRIAGDGKVRGIFPCAADYCKEISDNVRIDTHEKNTTMQHQVEKNGFIRCGIIYLEDGAPRIAYHWSRKGSDQ